MFVDAASRSAVPRAPMRAERKVLGLFVALLVAVGVWLAWGGRANAQADEHPGSGSAEEHPGSGSAEEHAAPAADGEHHEGSGSADEHAAPAADGEHHEGSGSAEEHAAPAADGEHHEGSGSAEEHAAPAAEGEHHEGAAEGEHGEGEHGAAATTGEAENGEDEGLGEPEGGEYKIEPIDQGGEVGVDGDGERYMEYDEDGDGQMSPEEKKDAQEFVDGFKEAGVDATKPIDDRELKNRPAGKQLIPSLTPEMFRKLVRLAKRKVLGKMEAKMAAKTAKKMTQFTWVIIGCSLAGFLMLFAPLFLRKKYPGQDTTLVKYSALAAGTFFVTVLAFGGVLFAMKTAQGEVGATSPKIAVAGGFFDTLDENAEQYITMGKELFAPTLEQLTSKSDEEPAVALIANGQKIVKDAMVFVRVAKMYKKLNFVFEVLPIILLLVTIVLFVLSIKPTLVEIIKLPAAAASGRAGVGGDVVRRAIHRVKGELLASLSALGVLFVLSLASSFILSQVVKPALTALIDYFSLAVDYLQFVQDASSTMVFLMLFSVIFFLALNVLTLILSMSFYLGKTQKIFQQRFNDGVPLRTHERFWKWGTGAVILVQLIPLVFVFIAKLGLEKINSSVMSGVTDPSQVSWKTAMFAGPLFLVLGYVAFFWAARGLKGILFLQRYKVKLPPPQDAAVEVAA
jgi:hypothetical protein